MQSRLSYTTVLLSVAVVLSAATVHGVSEQFQGKIYSTGPLKPLDSQTPLKVGDKAPDFRLPSLSGEEVSLGQFLGKKNVILSFVPAAWTAVCSEQWPGYNIMKDTLEKNNAVILGITVDNIPTLFAWTEQMGGVWFPVLSDFWPHGATSLQYGILRSGGVSERAIFLIDKSGIIRYMDVHDINERPSLENLIRELENLERG